MLLFTRTSKCDFFKRLLLILYNILQLSLIYVLTSLNNIVVELLNYIFQLKMTPENVNISVLFLQKIVVYSAKLLCPSLNICVQSHQNDAHVRSYTLLIYSFYLCPYLCPLSRELHKDEA